MSVTFTFPGMPTDREEYSCQYCRDGEGCEYCGGTGVEVIEVPANSVNWSNVNARKMFSVLGIDSEFLSGIILQAEFPRILRECIRLLNGGGLGELVTEEEVTDRVYICAQDFDSWRRRTADFQALVLKAQEAGQDIYFS